MSYTISWNSTDTAITAVGAVQPASLSFDTDYAKSKNDAQEATLVNLTSPVDRKESIRFGYSRIGNVYTGSDISPAYYAQNKTGASLLVQLHSTLSALDDVSGDRTDLPLSAHIVLKLPNHEVITGEIIRTLVARLIGAMYEKSDTTMDARVNALFHGAVLPKASA